MEFKVGDVLFCTWEGFSWYGKFIGIYLDGERLEITHCKYTNLFL